MFRQSVVHVAWYVTRITMNALFWGKKVWRGMFQMNFRKMREVEEDWFLWISFLMDKFLRLRLRNIREDFGNYAN